ncbi:MAG: hypothetical protein J6Z79_00045 [Clostridia bacterium]|nr:hypothetical protein [Clostridia bacterium]
MGLFDDLFGAAKNAAANAARSAGRTVTNEAQSAVQQAARSAVSQGKITKVPLASLPRTLAELQAMPEAALTDPNAAAALTIAALCVFPQDRAACYEMLNFLRGPRPMSPMDEAFIRDRFMDGKDYLPRSYFDGAKPDNDYTPDQPLAVTVKEQTNSREQEGYITLYLFSGGADNPRPVTFRNKPSTGQWFLWEYSGLLSGIRIPKSQDAWA